MTNIFYPDPIFRLPLYVILGLITEVIFTGLADLVAPKFLQSWNAKNLDRHAPNPIKRDPRAMGYTFLWMIPIYSLLILVEPLSQWMTNVPFYLRGLAYLIVFWAVEYLSGAFIKKASGYNPWDYSYSRFSFHGYVRWDFAPLWYSFSLIVEWFSTRFAELTPAIKQVFFQ